MEMVRELAESEEFEDATCNGVSKKRLRHYDFVSRFLAFYLQGYENYESNKMDKFIGNALQHLNDVFTETMQQKLKDVFFGSLSVCKYLLGETAFRQPLNEEDKKNKDIKSNPISISLFEAMMCSVSGLSEKEKERLLLKKQLYNNLYKKMFEDEFLRRELSNGTNQYKSVHYRFSKMEELVKSVIK